MAFMGMRGTGDWATNERPENWRQGILRLYPNGDAPLTAIMSMMRGEKTDDPKFHWWQKLLPGQSATVTNVYTDQVMSSAYTTGGAAGDTVYCKLPSNAAVSEFKEGHMVLLRNSANYADDTRGKVINVVPNAASSQIAVKLLQSDPTTTGLADCNTVLVVGSMHPEGASMPDSVAYDPTEYYNYTQIHRTALDITRTARKTKLRTEDAYKEAKRECLELHSIELEKMILWGYPYSGTGSNGKPERASAGLIYWINTYGATNLVADYSLETDTQWAGKTWEVGGEDWLDTKLEEVFRYGSDERMAFCGSGTILAINKLIKLYGNYQLESKTVDYGIKVKTWVTPFGDLHLKRHPLFSYEATNRTTMVIFDPKDITYKYIDDTTFYDDPDKKNTGPNRVDGTSEEYLTEAGYEFHFPLKCAYLNGFGSDNAQ